MPYQDQWRECWEQAAAKIAQDASKEDKHYAAFSETIYQGIKTLAAELEAKHQAHLAGVREGVEGLIKAEMVNIDGKVYPLRNREEAVAFNQALGKVLALLDSKVGE